MTFSIITPAFKQTDWLRLCVLSVADQVVPEACGIVNSLLNIDDSEAGRAERSRQSAISNQQSAIASPLRVEHIIQDAGSPGIEAFAREMASHLLQKYGGEQIRDLAPCEILHFRSASGYTLRVFKEPDAGMYDAINKGIAKMSGDLWAWLNSDEQYVPGALAYVAGWFSRYPDTEILSGDALLTDGNGNALSYRRIVRPLWRHTRLVHLASLSCASFYRRSIVDRVGGFDTAWRSIGDAEWMARMLKAGVRTRACRRLLASFAFTGQNTSESPLAGEEAAHWRLATDAPPSWQRQPMIWVHRFRKVLAGSYRYRSIRYALYSQGEEGRVTREARKVGWNWPVFAGSQMSEIKESAIASGLPGVVSILRNEILATDYRGLSEMLVRAIEAGNGTLAIDFANTHIVTMRRHDPDFAKLSECIDITVPDGMPLVWAMNRKGAGLKDRVYGPTFTREFLKNCPAGMTHYLVGGSEECGRRFRDRMLKINPSLNFVGGYHGHCSPDGHLEDDESVFQDILEKRPDFIWVGLGTPKQYGWIARIKPKLDHGVLLAVGFAFDVNAGMKPDAPSWMQRCGLTWLYRMASEPRRLVGRYLKWNSLFLFYVGAEPMFPSLLRMKLSVRNFCLRITDLFASEIKDCVTGESLGRGLFVSWGGRPWVIGHKGLPPLIPRFLPQKRLTYWKQAIGFTTHERPDFPRLDGVAPTLPNKARVINVVLTHLGSDKALSQLLGNWKGVCRPEDLWIAFGGSRRDFEALDYSRKVFVEDPNLRREDNQRQKQSYTGIFHAMKAVVEAERADSIYLCEYDHLPLVHDLNARQVDEMNREGADVMGHWLYRVDGSSHYHMLYHETDPSFLPFWESVSCREDRGVVLSMFGSGSMWSRNAFLAVASRPQEIPCYLELYLPTMAHHLGFRVRGWNESDHLLSNLPSRSITMESARASGCLTVHPVKALGKI